MAREQHSQKPGQRPRSVSILAVLQVIQSLGLLGYGAVQVVTHEWPEGDLAESPETLLLTLFDLITSGIGLIFLALLMFIVSIEMLRLRNWAWMASMSVQGLGLAASLLAYVRQEPNYPAMFLGVLLVFYLNQGEVQDAFRGKGQEL